MRGKLKWIVALLALGTVIYASYTLSCYVSGTKVEKREKTDVIIDAGHGGNDPGKVGVNKALEKDINLQIAKKLKKELEQKGITVSMTRETDEGLGENSKNKKVADMKARVKMVNEIKPAMVVSIHQNSYSSEEVKGAQVFYYSHSEEGKNMAETMQQALGELDPENHRQAKANDTYYLLKKTEVPTIIVESGFLSNYEEARLLNTDEYQNKMAKAICDGIMRYMDTNK